jgi:hypothetical protein
MFTLSACTGNKTLANGEYVGELSFPFIGNPEGEGVFKSNNGEEFEGIFSEEKFVGTVKNEDGTTFDGTVNGDVIHEETKKQLNYTYKGTYNDGENNYEIKEMTIDIENSTIIKKLHFDGNLEEDGIKFNGTYDYDKENKILILNGKYEENESDYFDGKCEISNFEDDIVYDEKFGFIEDFELEDIMENYNMTFDGIIDYDGIYMDGIYTMQLENQIITNYDFDGTVKDDDFNFEGKINFNRDKKQYSTDGIEKENDEIIYDGKLTLVNLSTDVMDGFNLAEGNDEFLNEDNYNTDFDFEGKMYDEGNLSVDGIYNYRSETETVTIDGKKYEKSSNEYVLFLDGKFTLTENNLKGEGKVYNIYDGSLIDSGNVDIDY